MIFLPTFRKIIRSFLPISFIAFALLQGAKAVEQPKTLFRVCRGDVDFLPFVNHQGTGRWQKLIMKAAATLPIEVTIHEVPRGRCVLEVQNHSNSDGFFGEPREEIKSTVSFPVNSKNELDKNFIIDRLSYYVVVTKDSKVTWDGKNLSYQNGEIFGVHRGRYIMEHLDNKNIPYDTSDIEKNFEKLKLKKIAGLIIDIQQYNELKKKYPNYDNKILPTQFASFDVYLGVSTPYYRKNKALIDQLWHNMKMQRKP